MRQHRINNYYNFGGSVSSISKIEHVLTYHINPHDPINPFEYGAPTAPTHRVIFAVVYVYQVGRKRSKRAMMTDGKRWMPISIGDLKSPGYPRNVNALHNKEDQRKIQDAISKHCDISEKQ